MKCPDCIDGKTPPASVQVKNGPFTYGGNPCSTCAGTTRVPNPCIINQTGEDLSSIDVDLEDAYDRGEAPDILSDLFVFTFATDAEGKRVMTVSYDQ